MRERHSGRIEMPDISAETGTAMIFYLYTGHVRDSANFHELLAVAEKYGMDELKKHCEEMLESIVNDSNWKQCCGSGLDPDSIRSVDPDPDSDSNPDPGA
jgi:hypothetical protein